ncbi:MAG: chemotaxis protein CheA [Lentisphaerales bacterium]|nr:chemotaxis protein CheA [Lentisphaerales bacterium]
MIDDSVDPNILLEFIDESIDSIEDLPQLFIKMEKDPHDAEVVNAIFRPVHSIKGNSAFFGLLKLKKLTHELESTLDKCRKGELTANKAIIDILLKGMDEVTDIFTRIRNGEDEINNNDAYDQLLSDIITTHQVTPPKAQEADYNYSPKVLLNIEEIVNKLEIVQSSQLIKGSMEASLLTEVIELLSGNQTSQENDESISSSMEGMSVYDRILEFISREISDSLPEEEVDNLDKLLLELKDQLLTSEQLESFEKMYDDFKTFSATVGFDSLLAELMKEKLTGLAFKGEVTQELTFEENASEIPVPESADIFLVPEPEQTQNTVDVEAEEPTKKTGVQLSKDTDSKDVSGKTMRVPENTIDEFLNFVGELVVVREMYDHLRLHYEEQGIAAELTTELRRHTDTFRQISGELERTCMNIRKQPIKQILRKLPRIVRDVAAVSGKEIDVEIYGDDIQVDKSLIGIIEDPLVHMIRNAADHGIESPEDRTGNDKDPCGKIILNVTEDEENLFISIQDDGKGLNYKVLLEKGIKIGIFHEGQNPSQQEIAQVIFMSGISTAEKITDISGRGVGMDVVKRYIENAGGSVSISSETGKGSEFKINLRKSVTTQIINGLIFRLDGICYVIPLKYVVENFPPEHEKFCNVYDKHEHIKRHDQLLPVIRLSELFSGTISSQRSKEDGILIVIDVNGRKVALLADEVVNIQQVVLKPLKGLHMKKEYFCGGALRGDGYISLILDIEHLLNGNELTLEPSENLEEV